MATTEITLSLKQLLGLFVRATNNDKLPVPIRQFAAQLSVLAGHVSRVEAKVDAEAKARQGLEEKLDGQIAELASLVMVAVQAKAPGAPTQAAAPIDGAPNGEAGGTEGGELSEDEEAEEMAKQVLAETEAEARALAAKPPTPPAIERPAAAVTPLRQPNAGKTAPAGEAS